MRRRVRVTPNRALKASHIPEPSARALCSVLRARELAGRGARGRGGRRQGRGDGSLTCGAPGQTPNTWVWLCLCGGGACVLCVCALSPSRARHSPEGGG